MRGDTQELISYFTHLIQLVNMSREWENPHRVPVELYLAGKKAKVGVKDRLFRY